MIADGTGPTFLWASIGTPDTPPARVQVFTCRDCGVLVRESERKKHRDWHTRLGVELQRTEEI